MYVCMYCANVCIYVCMYVCRYVCINVCINVCMYACTYVCMYVNMHVCTYICMHVYLQSSYILLLNHFTTVIWDNPFKTTEPLTIIIVASLITILFISISFNGIFICKLRKKCYHYTPNDDSENKDIRLSQTSDISAANSYTSLRRSSHFCLRHISESSIDSGIMNNGYMDEENGMERNSQEDRNHEP